MRLKEYLKKYDISFRQSETFFGLPYNTIFRISKGVLPRRLTAEIIVKKTKGEVSYDDLGYQNIKGMWIRPHGKNSPHD